MRWLLLLVLMLPLAAGEGGMRGAEELDDQERAQKAIDGFQREAANYRLARAQATADPAADTAAEAALARATAMRDDGGRAWYQLWMVGRTTRARWIAEDGFDDYPYAAKAGALLHFALDCHAANREVRGVLDKLMQLWFYLPSYDRTGAAMATALALAEKTQEFEARVDLDAERPQDVVKIDGRSWVGDANQLFLFLKQHGDRRDIAPRAALGLARSLLLSGERDDRWLSRRAYEDFLEDYPDSPLVFDAILEQALSYLATYKGADYDVGALLDARDLVDLAELEVGANAERAQRIAAYRKRLVGWLQDRDLSVATWYAGRTRPSFLTWLKRPTALTDPDTGARTYYRFAISRDRLSRQAQEAERGLAEVGDAR